MGAHKTNPIAIAAKKGELPPKEKTTLSKRQREKMLYKRIEGITGIASLRRVLPYDYYKWR